MTYRVEVTATALAEIEKAFDWIAERSPAAAERWRASLLGAVDALAAMPTKYGTAPEDEWYSGELRQMLIGKRRGVYRVLFEIVGDAVYVLRVRHGAQDLLRADEILN